MFLFSNFNMVTVILYCNRLFQGVKRFYLSFMIYNWSPYSRAPPYKQTVTVFRKLNPVKIDIVK